MEKLSFCEKKVCFFLFFLAGGGGGGLGGQGGCERGIEDFMKIKIIYIYFRGGGGGGGSCRGVRVDVNVEVKGFFEN